VSLHHLHKSLHKISYIKTFNFLHKILYIKFFSVCCATLPTTLLHIRVAYDTLHKVFFRLLCNTSYYSTTHTRCLCITRKMIWFRQTYLWPFVVRLFNPILEISSAVWHRK
jgi:hypothetical protein